MNIKEAKKHCEYFTKMEYTGAGNSYVIARGNYKGFKFLVVNCRGAHPCGYVDVKNTSLNKKDYTEIYVDCHGELTYSEEVFGLTGERGWWIGWDYGHIEDYIKYGPFQDEAKYPNEFRIINGNKKKHTTQEVVGECLNVIEQVIKIEKSNKTRKLLRFSRK